MRTSAREIDSRPNEYVASELFLFPDEPSNFSIFGICQISSRGDGR